MLIPDKPSSTAKRLTARLELHICLPARNLTDKDVLFDLDSRDQSRVHARAHARRHLQSQPSLLRRGKQRNQSLTRESPCTGDTSLGTTK